MKVNRDGRRVQRQAVRTGQDRTDRQCGGKRLDGSQQDRHRRSYRAEGGEKERRNTKSSVLQQQVGFVRHNKGAKCAQVQLEGKWPFSHSVQNSSALSLRAGKESVFEGAKTSAAERMKRHRNRQRDKKRD